MNQDLFKFHSKSALFLILTLVLAPFYFLTLLIFYRWRRSIGPKLVQFYSRICLLIFGVEIEKVISSRIPEKRKGVLIICNHTSFLDIFVLSALFGSVFVSKAEIKYYPIIGQIAWLSGVMFLDRSSSKERFRVLNTIANECPGRILAVFPQGTTSGIKELLPFHRGIFKAVEINPDISLLPVTLHYEEDTEIAWKNPQSLRENVIRVGSKQRIHVRVAVHDPVTIDDYQGKTAAQVCKMVEEIVLTPLRTDYR